MTASLLTTLGAVVASTPALAAGTVTDLFENLFNDRTVDGTGTVTVPIPPSGTNVACLTAGGNSATMPLLSCAGSVETQGNGKLRLTNSTINQVGGVFGQSSFPRSTGRDVTLNSRAQLMPTHSTQPPAAVVARHGGSGRRYVVLMDQSSRDDTLLGVTPSSVPGRAASC